MDSINTLPDELTTAMDSASTAANLSDGDVAGILAVVLAFVGVFIVLGIIWYVLRVVAYWRIFTKAGEAGWKSLIPFYNYYVELRLTWDAKFFWIFLAIFIAGIAAGAAGSEVLSDLLWVAMTVFTIYANYRLARAYGHGVGFTVGLVILNSIFTLILGFSKDQYQGNTWKQEHDGVQQQ